MAMLSACAKEDINHKSIADLAKFDPLLSVELLRLVNSPLFGLGREVKSVSHAITLLGHRALRNIIMCLAVRDLSKICHISKKGLTLFWEQALRRGVAAKLLAPFIHDNPDECFTLGLVADMGLLVLFHLQPKHTHLFEQIVTLTPDSRLQEEHRIFGFGHDETGELLAKSWGLPPPFVQAIGLHHGIHEQQSLTGMIALCDWIAAGLAQTESVEKCMHLMQEQFQLSQQQALETLCQIPHAVDEAAASLALHIEEQKDIVAVIQQANTKLAEANLSYQELTMQLRHAIRERDRLAAELDRELCRAREIQEGLLPLDVAVNPCQGTTVAAKQLSGDFFDYFALPDGRVYFNVADVSGKGVVAALLMAKTSSLFRCLGKRMDEPDKLLAILNDEIAESASHGMYVTLIAGIYNPADDTVAITNAGHPPAILMDANGNVRLIHAHGPPLGIGTGLQWQPEQFPLRDSCLYCYSDGLVETGPHKQFNLQVFVDSLRPLQGRGKREKLDVLVGNWKKTQTTHDDITLLLVQDEQH